MSGDIILTIVYSIVLVILLGLSFFFSSSDMVYGSVPLFKLENELAVRERKSVKTAIKLSKGYDKTISTILLLNDTVNAGLDSVSTLLGVTLASLALGAGNSQAELWGFIASMICLIVKITFGEILAKSYGKIKNLKLSILYAPVINVLGYIFSPITYLVSTFGKAVSWPLTKSIKEIQISEDDLHAMVDAIKTQGVVDEHRATILHETIRYTHTEAYEVMTPRVDIMAIDYDEDVEKILENSDLFSYSRLPVYQGTIDDIKGYILTKDLMLLHLNKRPIVIDRLLHPLLRFPRSSEVNDILKTFRDEKEHLALVIDEYGGVEGLISKEDIIEEIVGEIYDENDERETMFSKRSDGSYIVDGGLSLEDFCSFFNLNFEEIDTEYNTIGGYCIELLDDHFADVGSVIEFENLELKVLSLGPNQTVEKLAVYRKKEEEEEDQRN